LQFLKIIVSKISKSGEMLHPETGNSFEKSIVDNELLSKCDELLITGGSTYGFLAAMRMGRMPLFFNGERNSKQCARMSFTNIATTPKGYGVV
jgi:hypothetical protein